MDKIQSLIPKVLIETADKYVQAERELSRERNERFRNRVARIVKRAVNQYLLLGGCIIVGIIAYFLFRENKNE